MITYENNLLKVLKSAEKEASKLHHQYVGSEHFLLGILTTNNSIKDIFNRLNITYNDIHNEIKKIKINSNNNQLIYTPLLKRILLASSQNNNISLKNVFIRLIENGEGIAFTILNNLEVDIRKLYKELNNNKISYGINLNEEVKTNYNRITGREKEIDEIIEILCRKNKNNPILVGKAGVGKTAIIEELSHRIVNKNVPKYLYDKQIISVNISELVSGTKYRGEFEEKMNNLIKEFESNQNLILFIDEIHTLVGAGGAEGAIDASNIIKPALARNKIKCIGATTLEEYNSTIYKDKALNRRFYPVTIIEPNYNETIDILQNTKKYYENFHNVHINNNQIKLIVSMSNKYIKDRFEPDKSLDILDKICTKAKLLNYKNDYNIENTKLKELYIEKEKHIKNKDFKQATIINNKINKLKFKKHKIKVSNTFIKECYNLEVNNNIGFKIS